MNHRPRKRFGQNFLHDPGVIRRILAAIAPQAGEHLVEIGPGQGAITDGLLAAAGSLDVIELDRDLAAVLRERFADQPGFRLHEADALRVDFRKLAPAPSARLRVTGNLPYNISTPLLFHCLAQLDVINDLHFMLQKEVVDRMAAAPGGKAYGRLSVMTQVDCRVEPLFDIGPGAFSPPPRVRSSFVRLVPHAEAPWQIPDPALFADIVQRAFAQRRKTLRNSLKGLVEPAWMAQVDIDPVARAETLSIDQFAQLTRVTRDAAQSGDHAGT